MHVLVTVSAAQCTAESTAAQSYRAIANYPNALLGYNCAAYLNVELCSGFVDKINGFVR